MWEYTRDFKTRDGRTAVLKGDWNGDIVAFDDKGTKIGSLSLTLRDHDIRDDLQYLHLDHVEVDSAWRRIGVATACFLFGYEEIYAAELSVCAPSYTDTMKQHGNMLTIEGAAFVGHLRDKGLVLPDPAMRDERSNEF